MERHQRLSSLEMIERLIGFDTTSNRSNLELIAFVEDYLRSWGVASERIVSEDGCKANLWASLGRRDVGGGIILSGHSDVVPVEGQNWSSDPFRATIRDGRLYGRGACDMKSFIAIALAMVPDFLERSLRTPVHFAISYDEEVGCVGAPSLISHIRSHLSFSPATPLLAIIGEPSGMQVVNAHKSANLYETNIKGFEAHSSAPLKGVNAILAAGRLLCFLEDVGFEMRERYTGEKGFAERFDPPWTSVQVGEISGGTAINIIPKECWFNWEYRCLPGSDEEEIFHRFCRFAEDQLLPDMRSISQFTDITTRRLASVPSFSAGENSEAEALALRLSGRNQSYAIAGATEAGLFENAGFSAIICGPGSVLQAHRPDEFITVEQIKECEKFLERLLEHLRA